MTKEDGWMFLLLRAASWLNWGISCTVLPSGVNRGSIRRFLLSIISSLNNSGE